MRRPLQPVVPRLVTRSVRPREVVVRTSAEAATSLHTVRSCSDSFSATRTEKAVREGEQGWRADATTLR